MTNVLQSFDARVWAKEFVDRARRDPSFATDEGNMIGWFANALMRGFDEAQQRDAAKVKQMLPLVISSP